MKKKIFSILFALMLVLSLAAVALPMAGTVEASDPVVTPLVLERSFTDGVSEATFGFSTEPTIDGLHSAKLHIKNLQDCHEGVKIGVVSPYAKLDEIDPDTLSIKVNGDLLQEVKMNPRLDSGGFMPGTYYLDHSPYIIVEVDLGTDVGGHGSVVGFHATDLPLDGGPRITAAGPDSNGWYAVTPTNPAVWNGFFKDGKGIRTDCTAWDGAWPFPMFDTGTLNQWHDWISAVYPNYTVTFIAVGYGFVYPNYPGEWTAYVDDLTVNDTTYDFEPPPIEVEIDIKPGSDPNSINLGSKGVIPVAILTTGEFNAADVDAATVRFGPSEAAAVQYVLEDVDNDGDTDMILHFRTQETGILATDTSATLIGNTKTGLNIAGTDTVNIVPKGKGK